MALQRYLPAACLAASLALLPLVPAHGIDGKAAGWPDRAKISSANIEKVTYHENLNFSDPSSLSQLAERDTRPAPIAHSNPLPAAPASSPTEIASPYGTASSFPLGAAPSPPSYDVMPSSTYGAAAPVPSYSAAPYSAAPASSYAAPPAAEENKSDAFGWVEQMVGVPQPNKGPMLARLAGLFGGRFIEESPRPGLPRTAAITSRDQAYEQAAH